MSWRRDAGAGSLLGAAGAIAVTVLAAGGLMAADVPGRIGCLVAPVTALGSTDGPAGRAGACPGAGAPRARLESARGAAPSATTTRRPAPGEESGALTPAEQQQQARQTEVAAQLEAELGDRAGGVWVDAAGDTLHVGVTSAADAALVRAAGASPVVVQHTAAALEQTRDEAVRLVEAVHPGLLRWAWVDQEENGVVVEVTPDATDDQVAAVRAAVAAAGPVVVRRTPGEAKTLEGPLRVKWPRFEAGTETEIEREDDELEPEPSPEPLTGPVEVKAGQRIGGCTMAFAARSDPGGTPMFLTAGHCFSPMGTPDNFGSRDGHVLGLPWKVLYDDTSDSASGLMNGVHFTPTATVDTSAAEGFPDVQIRGQEEAPVGARVCKSGVTTGVTCGRITAHDVVGRNTPTQIGNLEGLTAFAACAQSGDSGSPVYTTDGQAQGILVRAVRDWYTDPTDERCLEDTAQGGESISFYEPIAHVLEAHDARLQLAP